MMLHIHKTRLKTENQEASKIRDRILEMEGLSKTARCERGEAGVCWTLKNRTG
jgi:hypothetical protein